MFTAIGSKISTGPYISNNILQSWGVQQLYKLTNFYPKQVDDKEF